MCPFHLGHLFSLHSSLFYLIWFLALSLCLVLFSSTLLISSSFSLPFLSSCLHFSFHFISPHIISLLILFFSLSSSLSLPHYLAFTPSFSLSLHIILSLSPFYVCFLYLIPLSLLSHFEVLHLCHLSLHYFLYYSRSVEWRSATLACRALGWRPLRIFSRELRWSTCLWKRWWQRTPQESPTLVSSLGGILLSHRYSGKYWTEKMRLKSILWEKRSPLHPPVNLSMWVSESGG